MNENKNYYYDDEETEIDIRSMFLYCLRHWRSLIVCVVLGTVLLGGGKYLRTAIQIHSSDIDEIRENYEAAVNQYDVQVDAYNKQISDAEEVLTDASADAGTITSAQNTITSAQSALESLEEPEEPEILSAEKIRNDVIKFALIGLFAGIALHAMWFALKYIASGRIYDDDLIFESYGFDKIAAFGWKPEKKHNTKLDKKLASASSTVRLPDNKVIEVAEVVLHSKLNGEAAALVSTINAGSINQIEEYLENSLTNVKGLKNVLDDPSNLRRLSSYKKAVLIEKKGKSKVKDIQQLVSYLHQLNIEVIGYIMV